MICQAAGLYQLNPEPECTSVFPDFSSGFGIPDMSSTYLLKLDFSKVLSLDFIVVMFAFLLLICLTTLGFDWRGFQG